MSLQTIRLWPDLIVSHPSKLPPHVFLVRNRTGRPYLYWQRGRGGKEPGKRVRLPDDPRSPEFWAQYAELERVRPIQVNPACVSEVARSWMQSTEWTTNSPRTKEEWGKLVTKIVAAWGEVDIGKIEPKHVLALRDRFAATPATANNILRCLSSMLSWSVPRGYRADNPCREIKKLATGDGYEPWPWEDIEAARIELQAGRVDLWWAVALALYTGQRQADVLAMRWDAISGGLLAVKQGKTGKRLAIPLHKDLRAVLDAIPRRAVTILTSAEGTPWQGGFSVAWNKHKPKSVLAKGLVFHGLRKSAVVTLLEAGCSDAEVAAITGQSRAMVEHYARMVNQQHLARAAILKWEGSR